MARKETQLLRVGCVKSFENDLGDAPHGGATIHRRALYPLERLWLRHLLLGLEQTLGTLHQLAGLQPVRERRDFQLQRRNLAESTDQIVVSLRPALKRSAISLTVDVPAGIQMDSYPGPYGQVLTNLVLNSLAHAFPDRSAGTMRISARRIGAEQVEVQFADDGSGMSEDVQRRAFEPFFTTRRSRGGTGLGLHIVYNLVTRPLGGRLRLESQPGRGTIFVIRLPLVAPKAEPADGSRAASFAESP